MELTKARTSRCREWERQRRNKFNEAIIKLGEVVKEINNAENGAGKDVGNAAQFPKIEIIQNAIICLTNCAKERTKLKADILALQVRIDQVTLSKTQMKDATTQATMTVIKKNAINKYLKLVMLQKSKRNALKEKQVCTTNITVPPTTNVTEKSPTNVPVKPTTNTTVKPTTDLTVKSTATITVTPTNNVNVKPPTNAAVKPKSDTNSVKQTSMQVTPKILPKSDDKKSPDTIVVLPAAQYIFPQRPFLFPTVPPAILLVDPNLQSINKPLNKRNNGDVTKTTMVNILPISAYSRPMSATRSKKSNLKQKKESNKKTVRISKPAKAMVSKEIIIDKPEDKSKKSQEKTKESKESLPTNNQAEKIHTNVVEIESNEITLHTKDKTKLDEKEPIAISDIEPTKISSIKEKEITPICQNVPNEVIADAKNITVTVPSTIHNSENSLQSSTEDKCKVSQGKIPTIDKNKDSKLPNILESSLCDTTVDPGNACLDLAEELLADSPKTAAYLMSFPLVSGNRIDSPAEESQNTLQTNAKESNPRRSDTSLQPVSYFDKQVVNEPKTKSIEKTQPPTSLPQQPPPKASESQKYTGSNLVPKQTENKITSIPVVSSENPFLNLSLPSLTSTTCTITDTTFGLEFDCNIHKSTSQSNNFVSSSNNFFYKSDPFSSVKNTIYSTSSISSSHDFNSLGLYPCAMEKYTSKNKSDYSNVEENLMKIGSSRLTYDIDLGWSHKSFDFVNCTTSSNTFCKDNILTTVSAPYSTTYNPFNPDFHIPLVSTSSKKENISTKSATSFADTITNFYSQSTNLWSEDVPFYTNNNVTKSLPAKHQNYLSLESIQTNNLPKPIEKHFESKQTSESGVNIAMKPSNVTVEQHIPEKFTKKSPTKMHINWMTSETRPLESICNPGSIASKDSHKNSYSQISQSLKKHDQNESYFPISMHNFIPQPSQEEFQMWPSTRQVGPTEISIEPPPINLPTLVGDLALGPHDKKKNTDRSGTAIAHTQDIQNCGNFLSVTQLMNRSSDNMSSRYQVPTIEPPKTNSTKQISSTYFSNDIHRKTMSSRLDSQLPQPCYGFNESKLVNSYESMSQFTQNKNKTSKPDKNNKAQKSNYSAESLIRGGGCTQKIPDNNNAKFMMHSQKYNEFNAQDNSVAQVSHFPPMLDYSDNSYATQQFSGTTLYNSTPNTIANSFYSNFMPGSSNLMTSNYTGGPFTGEFLEYNQTDCNYTNHKYEELKMRNNPAVYSQDKVPSNYKSSRRESAAKHKLECSKKDSSKKYQSKRAKLNTDVDEWSDPSHALWQNKSQNKRHTNLMPDELAFPNYVGNQMPTQYQPEFFNSHLMPTNVQSVSHNVERTIPFPATSRANFNLSTIFPEITMKVQ